MSPELNRANQSPDNLYASQQKMLVERLEFFLSAIPGVLRADIKLALEEKGKLLACGHQVSASTSHTDPPAGSWSLLTLLVAQYISPDIDLLCASSVAIAIECYICALDLLDDVEDEDQTPIVQTLGPARVLNVSTALLALAHTSLLSLAQLNISAERMLQLLQLSQDATLTATVGQQRDLLAEQRPAQDIMFEECIEIAGGKAGALMSLACQLGAVCAGASEEQCKQFAEAGKLLGIAHQLDNDCHDLYDLLQADTFAPEAALTSKSSKTDLVRNKKTLPVVLAAGKGVIFRQDTRVVDQEIERTLKALKEGITATWGICLLYRERARECLQEMEARRPMAPLLGALLGL